MTLIFFIQCFSSQGFLDLFLDPVFTKILFSFYKESLFCFFPGGLFPAFPCLGVLAGSPGSTVGLLAHPRH